MLETPLLQYPQSNVQFIYLKVCVDKCKQETSKKHFISTVSPTSVQRVGKCKYTFIVITKKNSYRLFGNKVHLGKMIIT